MSASVGSEEMQAGVACSTEGLLSADGGISFVGVAVSFAPQAERNKTMTDASKIFFIIKPSN